MNKKNFVMIIVNYIIYLIVLKVADMAVSYKKLWKLLIDLDMKKKDLQQAAGISSALIAKLGRNENVSTESLVKSVQHYIVILEILWR